MKVEFIGILLYPGCFSLNKMVIFQKKKIDFQRFKKRGGTEICFGEKKFRQMTKIRHKKKNWNLSKGQWLTTDLLLSFAYFRPGKYDFGAYYIQRMLVIKKKGTKSLDFEF
jgi:hypothetical protein